MSPDQRRRYSRQIRLPEIGVGGQAKLCAARVDVHGEGFARTIEDRYVRRAGMQVTADRPTVDPRTVDRAADVAALGLRHVAAREVGEGALRALAAMRSALEDRPAYE